MKYTLSLILIFLALFAKAQNSAEDVKFLNEVVDIKRFKTQGFYVDRFPANQLDEMKKMLNKDTIHSNSWNWHDRTFFVFSKSEREFIVNELEKIKNFRWQNGLIADYKMLTQDTVDNIFNDKYRWWPYFNNHYGVFFYQFSKPIFLRNHTVCVYYQEY